MHVEKDKQLGGRRSDYLCFFLKAGRQNRERVAVRKTIDRLAHAVAARSKLPRLLPFRRFDRRFVRRAMIDGSRPIVRKELPPFDVGRRCVEPRVAGTPGEIRVETEGGPTCVDVINKIIRRQKAIKIEGVQMKTQLQLPEVVQAGNV